MLWIMRCERAIFCDMWGSPLDSKRFSYSGILDGPPRIKNLKQFQGLSWQKGTQPKNNDCFGYQGTEMFHYVIQLHARHIRSINWSIKRGKRNSYRMRKRVFSLFEPLIRTYSHYLEKMGLVHQSTYKVEWNDI